MGRNFFFCASVPLAMMSVPVMIMRVITEPTDSQPRESSSVTMRHRQRVEAHAAVLGREDETEVAELGHLPDDRHRDLFFRVVELVGDRHHLALDELADRLTDL